MTRKDYLKAMGCFEPEPFMKSRIAAGIKRERRPRRIRPLRTALLAAALCLALVGTAVAAAEMSGVRVVELFNNELRSVFVGGESENYSGYAVEGDIQYFPMDALSAEILEAGEHSSEAVYRAVMQDSSEGVFQGFSSWEDMEQFIGVDLMNNPVLEAAPGGIKFGMPKDGDWDTACYVACVNVLDGVVPRVHVDGSYRLYPGKGTAGEQNCISVEIGADLYTENALALDVNTSHDVIYFYYEGTEITQEEEYITSSGLPVQILRIYYPDRDVEYLNTADGTSGFVRHDEVTRFAAEFTLNGVLFTLNVDHCEDTDVLRATLLEILENFAI